MILIQESPLSGQIITLLKPVGKEIPFRLGEILEGQVADIFPSGGLTIKVKGGYLPVRSELNFEKNETIFLKVLGEGKKNGEIVLQLINNKSLFQGDEQLAKAGPNTGMSGMEDPVRKATELILKIISSGVESRKAPTGQSLEIGKLRMVLGELLNSLPTNIESLPKGLRTQLLTVLQSPVEGLFSDIQERILQIIKELTGEVQYSLSNNNLKDILIPVEGLDSGNLKNALQNSGVLLEAKLRAMVKSNLQGAPAGLIDSSKIDHDLKAIMLQLKENIQGKRDLDSPPGFLQKFLELGVRNGEKESHFSEKVSGVVNNLVKDVEIFQLLSRVSDSLHTFLPIQWDQLKQGELVLKRRHQSKGMSYSCSIHLDLERLGPVSVFLFMQSKDFYLNFKTDHSQLKAMIHSHLEELQETFSREGLNLKSIKILEKRDTHSDPLERIGSEETIISIRI